MKIAVTGANGMLGQYAVAELLNAGHSVRPIDLVRPTQHPDDFRKADVRDLGQVCGALHGCDAVLHLAAIPTLTAYSYDDVFANNVLGAFNVLEAAALLDIKRVVTASSCSALGVAYAFRPVPLRYVPVDEEHPLLPQDAYGLSKQIGEDICAAFHRRTGNVAVSIRFSWIWDPQVAPQRAAQMAEDERAGVVMLWSYVDARDAACVCRLALETSGLTTEAFYVAAPKTFARRPSAVLARQYFPTAEIRGDEYGHWAFHDCSLAERKLAFKAKHDWSTLIPNRAD